MRLVCALFILCWPASAQIPKDTITPEKFGEDVVAEVVKLVEDALGETHNLLLRTAWVESKFGSDKGTYRPGYDGGIWQVDEIGFRDTQNTKSHSKLTNAYKTIKDKLGIDWPNVTYSDLRKPLYSGLAARLKYRNIPDPIPDTLCEQAKYWKKHYNTEHGKGTARKFHEDVKQKWPKC